MKMFKKSMVLGLICGLFCSNIFGLSCYAANKDTELVAPQLSSISAANGPKSDLKRESIEQDIPSIKTINHVTYSENFRSKKNFASILETPVIINLKYNKGKTSITLSWKKIKNAYMYFVYKKNNSSWEKIATTSSTSCTTDIVYKNSNTYTVKAVGKSGNSWIYGSYESSGITAPYNDYSDLNIVFEGDSITYGKYGTSGYPNRVKIILGCNVSNQAINGSTAGAYKNTSNNNILYRLENGITTYKNYDVICIAIGTNDYAFGKKLGSASDTKEDKSFNGYMNSLISEIRSQNNNSPIVLITPIYRGEHAKISAGYNAKNSSGYTLGDIGNTIKDMPNRYDNVYVYDSKYYNIINESNAEEYLYDMLHPNDTGYALIGNSISSYLKKYILASVIS